MSFPFSSSGHCTFPCNLNMSRQSRFDAQYWMLGAGALGQPRGMVWGGRREEGSGWGTHVYLWWIHFDIWQDQYNIVKFKNKIKLKKKKNTLSSLKASRRWSLVHPICAIFSPLHLPVAINWFCDAIFNLSTPTAKLWFPCHSEPIVICLSMVHCPQSHGNLIDIVGNLKFLCVTHLLVNV